MSLSVTVTQSVHTVVIQSSAVFLTKDLLLQKVIGLQKKEGLSGIYGCYDLPFLMSVVEKGESESAAEFL